MHPISYDAALKLKEYGYTFVTNKYYYPVTHGSHDTYYHFRTITGDDIYVNSQGRVKRNMYWKQINREKLIGVPEALELIKILVTSTCVPLDDKLLNLSPDSLAELIFCLIGPLNSQK